MRSLARRRICGLDRASEVMFLTPEQMPSEA